jgi:hypothetical protein
MNIQMFFYSVWFYLWLTLNIEIWGGTP